MLGWEKGGDYMKRVIAFVVVIGSIVIPSGVAWAGPIMGC